MKKINQKVIGIIICSLLSFTSFAQNWKQGGNGAIPAAWDVAIPANQLIGTTTAFPMRFITNNVQRMTILGSGPTAGFVGIATTNPLFRLHIDGTGTGDATGLGWNKGLLMSNQAAIMWEGNPLTTLNYFMAHASFT